MSFAKSKSFKNWMESGTSTASVAMFKMPLMDLNPVRNGDLKLIGSDEDEGKKKKSSKSDKKDKDE